MSSQLLAECIKQFDLHGFKPEFQSYFMRQKSRLLSSGDVAFGLMMLIAQSDSPDNASQLMTLFLDEVRMGLENDVEYVGAFLEHVETAVQAGLATGALQPAHVMKLAGLYRRVDLPVPKSFILDPKTISAPPDMEDFHLSDALESIARDVQSDGGSAYDLYNAINSILAPMPEEVQAELVHHIAAMEGPFFERCALFMLLSDLKLVQEATITGLFDRLDTTALSAETMMLLPMIRGWFADGPVQKNLDTLIKKTRRKAVPTQISLERPIVQEIVASITDGVGAQSVAVRLTQGAKTLVAMLMIKTGYGIKDAFLVPVQNNNDAEGLIEQMRAEVGANDVSPEILRVLLEGALADGLENGCLPAPGFLDVIEVCNFYELRPQALSLMSLLDLADPERKIQEASAQALGRWINDDLALDRLEYLTDSWFEDTKETRKIIAEEQKAPSIEAKIWKFLETRRDLWARRFLQTAVMLRDGGQLREWKTLTASAHGLMTGRQLKRIPLMEDLMYMTIEAADAKEWGL